MSERLDKKYLTGTILLLVAGGMWSLNGALIKLINNDGQGPGGVVIAFYRSLFAGLVLLPLAWGKLHTLSRDNQDQYHTRADQYKTLLRLRPAAVWCVVFFTLMTVAFVIANTKTEAANAILLQYTSTFWIFGLSPWVLKEKPQGRAVSIMIFALVGIGVIFAGNASTDLAGLLIALCAGLFFALLSLMIRRMQDCNSAAITVLNNLGSALLIFPIVLVLDDLWVSQRSLLLLILMGVVQFGIPYYLYTLGLARVPAYSAALLIMVEPVLVPLWAYLAVGETVPTTTMVGGSIILFALVMFVLSSRTVSPK